MKRSVAFAVITFFLLLASSFSQEFYLNNLILDNINGKIQIRFSLDIGNSDKLISYLKEGIILKLNCKAQLREDRRFWKDRLIYVKKKEFKISFNPLTKEYIISSGKNFSERDKNLDQLFKRVWEKLIIDLGSWQNLKKNKKYIFQLSLKMVRSDIPKWMKRILFFINWDVISEKEYRIKFYL